MVNIPWCHDCNNPEGLCSCESDPLQDYRDYHEGVVSALMDKMRAAEANLSLAIEALERIVAADDAFRATMRPDVAKDPVTLACDAARPTLYSIKEGKP